LANIHKTAIVEAGAKLADDVKVGAWTYIGKDVSIDKGTTIASHCVIEGKTTIGKNNQIFAFSVIGSIPQDLKYDGTKTRLNIGNNNIIREHTLINTGTVGGGGVTTIQNNCLIMGHCHIGHDCLLEDSVIMANSCAVAGHVEFGANCVIGGMSAVHQFCKIGEFSMIGGGSILVQDMPPYSLCEGNRAVLRNLNITGLRRNFKNSDIQEIKKAYKDIFRSGKNIKEVAKELYETNTNIYVKNLSKFIIETKRGIPFER